MPLSVVWYVAEKIENSFLLCALWTVICVIVVDRLLSSVDSLLRPAWSGVYCLLLLPFPLIFYFGA